MDSQVIRVRAAWALAFAGAAWPSALCFVTDALASPTERLLASAWCGAAPQGATLLGHCALCWSGSAALLAAAALLALSAARAPLTTAPRLVSPLG